MNELHTNMVPFPRLHYISSSVSPLLFPTTSSNFVSGKSVKPDNLFTSAWSRENQLLKINPLGGTLLGATILGRGSISVSDIHRNIDRFRSKVKFVPWSVGDAVKIGLCSVPPPGLTSSVMSLVNTSNMSSIFKNAHVHHYLQVPGFSKEDFADSLESLIRLEDEYSQMDNIKAKSIPRLQTL
ncbi:Tubulin epsilon chain [Blattella germanica]|nr:Tubulin epsilon chain [Blattella germanica]